MELKTKKNAISLMIQAGIIQQCQSAKGIQEGPNSVELFSNMQTSITC